MASTAKPALPPSLQAYYEGKSPVAMMSASGHTRQPQPAVPPRSRMLAAMLADQGAPDMTGAAVKAAPGIWKGYNQVQADTTGNAAADSAREKAGYANVASGLTGVAGGLVPGWGGKVAQIVSMMTGQYGADRAEESEAAQMKSIFNEPDADKRNKLLMYYMAKRGR